MGKKVDGGVKLPSAPLVGGVDGMPYGTPLCRWCSCAGVRACEYSENSV